MKADSLHYEGSESETAEPPHMQMQSTINIDPVEVCSVVRVPTIEEEDAKRQHREREHLIQERVRIDNRIAALLTTQGIRKRPSLRSWE
jgi:transposase